MATTVVTNPLMGGIETYEYDYSQDNTLSSLVAFMQANDYKLAHFFRNVNSGGQVYTTNEIYPLSALVSALSRTQPTGTYENYVLIATMIAVGHGADATTIVNIENGVRIIPQSLNYTITLIK